MKVSDYVPKLYKNNVEFTNIISSEEDDLENILKPYIEQAYNDNFAITASKNGLENYEKLLKIDLDENRDNLEYRRAKVIAVLTTQVPLSYRWLENNLISLVGKDNYRLRVDYNNYTINIDIGNVYKNTAETLKQVYRPLIPANMIIIVNLFQEENANVYVAGILQEGEKVLYKMSESEVS